jgi:hypothetical protein
MMALRIRDRKSAMGSVIDMRHLPARFDDAGDITAQRKAPETDTAQLELAQERTRAPALLASVLVTYPPFGGRSVHIYSFRHGQFLKGIPR